MPSRYSLVVFEMRQVNDATQLEGPSVSELLQQFGAPLAPAARCQHRVQDRRSVSVETDPVVREDGIGTDGFRTIRENMHDDTRVAQRTRQRVEFDTSELRGQPPWNVGAGLVAIAALRLGVPTEGRGPDHHHCTGALCRPQGPVGGIRGRNSCGHRRILAAMRPHRQQARTRRPAPEVQVSACSSPAVMSRPSHCRTWISPRRIWVFTVPSGRPVALAISE